MAIKTCKIKFEKVLAFMSNWYQFFDFLACWVPFFLFLPSSLFWALLCLEEVEGTSNTFVFWFFDLNYCLSSSYSLPLAPGPFPVLLWADPILADFPPATFFLLLAFLSSLFSSPAPFLPKPAWLLYPAAPLYPYPLLRSIYWNYELKPSSALGGGNNCSSSWIASRTLVSLLA